MNLEIIIGTDEPETVWNVYRSKDKLEYNTKWKE